MGATRPIPLPKPGELHHYRAESAVASLPDPWLSFYYAAVVWRRCQTGVRPERFSVGEVTHEGFADQYSSTLHADFTQAAKLLDHSTGIIRSGRFGCRIAVIFERGYLVEHEF